jgi:hypothetical protein
MTPDRKRTLLILWIARKPRCAPVVEYGIRENKFVMRAADLRFSYLINTDEVFGTHRLAHGPDFGALEKSRNHLRGSADQGPIKE